MNLSYARIHTTKFTSSGFIQLKKTSVNLCEKILFFYSLISLLIPLKIIQQELQFQILPTLSLTLIFTSRSPCVHFRLRKIPDPDLGRRTSQFIGGHCCSILMMPNGSVACVGGERQCVEEGFSDKGRLLMVGNSACLPTARRGGDTSS